MTYRTAQARRLFEAAAIAWWKARRPPGYSFRQHLAEPDFGMRDDRDVELARALAAWLERQRQPDEREGGR